MKNRIEDGMPTQAVTLFAPVAVAEDLSKTQYLLCSEMKEDLKSLKQSIAEIPFQELMCICVLQFSLHYINYRWSCKFVYSPLSFPYKYIVSHSTVSHLVRVKDQIKHCKSIEDLSFNFIFCDHHMRPLLHISNYTSW